MNWIKRAWRWSRTVFVNVAAILAVVLVELITYAVGIDWKQFFGDYWGGVIGVALGAVNIVMRIWFTSGPVGETEDDV